MIRASGKVDGGRRLDHIGAHAGGQNGDSIGICMIGGLGEDWKPTDKEYTEEQWDSLELLVFALQDKLDWGLSVHGHNEYAAKACPCFDVIQWWATYTAELVPNPLNEPPPEPLSKSPAVSHPLNVMIDGVRYVPDV